MQATKCLASHGSMYGCTRSSCSLDKSCMGTCTIIVTMRCSCSRFLLFWLFRQRYLQLVYSCLGDERIVSCQADIRVHEPVLQEAMTQLSPHSDKQVCGCSWDMSSNYCQGLFASCSMHTRSPSFINDRQNSATVYRKGVD